MRRALVLGAVALVAGCGSIIGLSDFEIVDHDEAGVDSAVPDTNVVPVLDAGEDADATIVIPPIACTAEAGACDGLDLDGGWRPVAIIVGHAQCPAGFATADTEQGMPTLTPGACGCALDTSQAPTSCTGTAYFVNGDAGTCTVQGTAYMLPSENTCIRGTFAFAHFYDAFEPPDASGASCTAKTTTDPTKVATAPITLCAPTATCSDTVCAGANVAPLRACLVADGDVACPDDRFSAKIPIGTGVSALSCSSDCTCTVASETCGGQLQIFKDPSCLTEIMAFDAGACTQTAVDENKPGDTVTGDAVRYASTRTATYAVDGGKTATSFTLAAPRTLCCVP